MGGIWWWTGIVVLSGVIFWRRGLRLRSWWRNWWHDVLRRRWGICWRTERLLLWWLRIWLPLLSIHWLTIIARCIGLRISRWSVWIWLRLWMNIIPIGLRTLLLLLKMLLMHLLLHLLLTDNRLMTLRRNNCYKWLGIYLLVILQYSSTSTNPMANDQHGYKKHLMAVKKNQKFRTVPNCQIANRMHIIPVSPLSHPSSPLSSHLS
ncbi:hypothetical protein DFS34DRAFT_504497 [Phlyctochytrium arcticum]|nr:hypothetical protein DFS34DRAFT_504497 [Phlyctochytrium arcticum]